MPSRPGQPRGERRAGRRGEVGLHRPVLAGAERLDLGLAVADQAERDRLHATGRAAARQLAPQHRREGEADQIVQRAAGQIGLDQRLVELARRCHGGAHGAAGDLVEGDAADRDALQRLLLGQHRLHVPGDRLALAVGVGGEIQRAAAPQRLGDRADMLVAARVGLPVHGEVLLGAHRTVLRRQVAHVAHAGQHGVSAAQIAVDGLGLGGGLDDDDV